MSKINNKLSKISFGNKALLMKSNKAACYHCLKIMDVIEIVSFIKEKSGKETAVCPYCGIDSILPDQGKSLPTDEELKAYSKEMFW